jgi:hypothetical protein
MRSSVVDEAVGIMLRATHPLGTWASKKTTGFSGCLLGFRIVSASSGVPRTYKYGRIPMF